MMNAPSPQNETQRLKVLWQYDVLDTVPEEIFDLFPILKTMLGIIQSLGACAVMI